jgi:hypothetical protein
MPAVRQSLKTVQAAIPDKRESLAVRQQLENIQQDLANLRAAFVALTAKLDADVGVTDTNYAATTNPAALFTQP